MPSDEALNLLMEYPWPGNVRELQNAIQKILARAQGPLITSEDIVRSGAIAPPGKMDYGATSTRRVVLREFEKNYLIEALKRHDGNITHTARALGIHRATLQRILKKYGITSPPQND